MLCGFCGEWEADFVVITESGCIIAECAHCEALGGNSEDLIMEEKYEFRN